MKRQEVEDYLKHTGVKGMKWGVHRLNALQKKMATTKDPKKLAQLKQQHGLIEDAIKYTKTKSKGPGLIRQHLDSMKRERSWKKVLDEVNSMTTKELGVVSRRAGLENEMKKLSRTGSDKKNYLRRANMSDQELNRKVARLRAINALTSQSDSASKAQREFGKRVVQTAGSLAFKVYLSKKAGGKISAGDIFESVHNPKAAQAQATKLVLDSIFKKKAQ